MLKSLGCLPALADGHAASLAVGQTTPDAVALAAVESDTPEQSWRNSAHWAQIAFASSASSSETG